MKNESLFPLERNNYFFGKLMTEREFSAEQDYFNNKRRLLSLLTVGAGVVCGLTVTKVDGATIAVESGLAIDGLGRELVAPQLCVTRLSELEGFGGDRGHASHVYLCAQYDEISTEPMHAMTGSTDDTARFGRVRETLRLTLRYGEPEPFEIAGFDAIPSDEYRAENLEKKLERGGRQRLYLAKIHLVRWEEAYEIDAVEQVPFGQYARLPASAPTMPAPASAPEPRREAPPAPVLPAEPKIEHERPPSHAFGVADIRVPKSAKTGSVHYSDDIPHGLGLTPVALTLGGAAEGGAVFGNPELFGAAQSCEYAARANERDGTFRIAVKLNTSTQANTVRVYWAAFADPGRTGDAGSGQPRIVIHPPLARLRPRETLRLTAEVYGRLDEELRWLVQPNGGDITNGGAYTAPAEPGVYTVEARAGEVFATAYIAVN